MKRTIQLRIDRLRLDRGATGLVAGLGPDLEQALRLAILARQSGAAPDWPATTRPALRHAAETLVAQVPVAGAREGS
jgi:hypothetical protein